MSFRSRCLSHYAQKPNVLESHLLHTSIAVAWST
jgi:hypothetical protein